MEGSSHELLNTTTLDVKYYTALCSWVYVFFLGTVCKSWQEVTAMVAVVSVPHCTQNCADTEVTMSPEGHLKADAGCLLPVTHVDWREGGQACTSML